MKNTTEQKHTPTPWKVGPRTQGVIELNSKAGNGIANMCIGYPYNHDEANAAFIVRAVNRYHAFEELLQAAKELFSLRNTLLTRAGVSGYRETTDGKWVADPASMAFNKLGEMIAQAEGE